MMGITKLKDCCIDKLKSTDAYLPGLNSGLKKRVVIVGYI